MNMYNRYKKTGKLPPKGLDELSLFRIECAIPFVVEAVFVFFRRFMIGLMRSPAVATLTIVVSV